MKTITVRMLRGKWTADKVKDGDLLRSIIGAHSFAPSEYDRVLSAVSEFGFVLETI